MEREETLARLAKLLGCLPGVQVAWASNKPEAMSIGLVIDSCESLALLAREGAFANTPPLRVWLAGTVADPRDIRYILEVPEALGVGHRLTPLQILGVFLARDLKARGLMPTEEADEMQIAWNAVVM